MSESEYSLRPIGVLRSSLRTRADAPKQGHEGAPDAWVELDPQFGQALNGVAVGDEVIVITWLHQADRDTLMVHPRSDKRRPLAGVFATRSPDRPNPIGLHTVKVLERVGDKLKVVPIEAIDGTPVIDIKPMLC